MNRPCEKFELLVDPIFGTEISDADLPPIDTQALERFHQRFGKAKPLVRKFKRKKRNKGGGNNAAG